MLKRAHVALDEDLLGLVEGDEVKRLGTRGQSHHEHPRFDHDAVQNERELSEVDFRFLAQGMNLGDHDLSDVQGRSTLSLGHVAPDGGLRDFGIVFFDEALKDSSRSMTLLLWRGPVSLEPTVDQFFPRVQHRRGSIGRRARRRHCAHQSLADGSTMNTELLGQHPNRNGLGAEVGFSDFFEQHWLGPFRHAPSVPARDRCRVLHQRWSQMGPF